VHGFGFASVLSEIGLPPLDVPAALLFFNIGVEIGQIIFVVALIGAHAVIATLVPKIHGGRGKEIANRTSAYAIGTIASFWLLQRLSVF